jgi:hypothetical protein
MKVSGCRMNIFAPYELFIIFSVFCSGEHNIYLFLSANTREKLAVEDFFLNCGNLNLFNRLYVILKIINTILKDLNLIHEILTN